MHLVRLVSTILHSCLSLCILGIKEAVINLQLKSLGVKTTVRTRGIREMLLGIFLFFLDHDQKFEKSWHLVAILQSDFAVSVVGVSAKY